MVDNVNNSYKLYLINLDESTDRLQSCTQRLASQGLSFERISAVLGRALVGAEKYKHYSLSDNKKKYYRSLTDGEIGCYLSHRKAWEMIAAGDEKFGVVLEDDIELKGRLDLALDALDTIPFDWQVMKLSAYRNRTRRSLLSKPVTDQFRVAVLSKPMSGCAATAISKNAAKQLLLSTSSFGRPVDVDIQHFWETGVNVYSLLPYPVAQDISMESTIAGRHSTESKSFWKRKKQQLSSLLLNRSSVRKQLVDTKKNWD